MSKHTPGEAKRERRMNAYYYSFTETGVDPVDDILEKVAMAGKGLHNTDGWAEELEWMENKSYVDLIQESAIKSAEEFNAIKTQRDELLAALQELAFVAERCDNWDSFPLKALDDAKAAINKAIQ